MDHLVFDSNHLARDGDAMIIEAQVVRCFNTSAEVVVHVLLDPSLSSYSGSGSPVCVAHAFFVFVRMDRGVMPQTFPQTAAETSRHRLSAERRLARQQAQRVRESDPLISTPNSTDGVILCDKSALEFMHIVLPTHANHMGNLFGGEILQWAEEIALLSATRLMTAALDTGHLLSAEASLTPEGPRFSLATVYVHGMSFLRPSTVGDRIIMRAQCCRSFGCIAEIEVTVTAADASHSSVRTINTGYFVVCCWDGLRSREASFPTVAPITLEDRARFDDSLRRMVVASVRSASAASLGAPHGEYAVNSSMLQLSQMLAVQEASIWNSSLPSSLSLSSQFEAECASEFSFQDVSGLLCSLSPAHDSIDAWSTLNMSESYTMHSRLCTNGVVCIKLEVLIRAAVSNVAALIMDLAKRPMWDTILTGYVVRSVSDNVSLVWMGSATGIDYSLLRCYRELEDGRIVIVSRSIVHPDIQPAGCLQPGSKTPFKRGEVLPSGFLLSPVDINSGCTTTKLQYLLQLDGFSAEQFAGKFHF